MNVLRSKIVRATPVVLVLFGFCIGALWRQSTSLAQPALPTKQTELKQARIDALQDYVSFLKRSVTLGPADGVEILETEWEVAQARVDLADTKSARIQNLVGFAGRCESLRRQYENDPSPGAQKTRARAAVLKLDAEIALDALRAQ